jgi:hypothetical protein
MERLRRAIAKAAKSLAQKGPSFPERNTPQPGDLYVVGGLRGAHVEWLIVGAHPDGPGLLKVVPVDDFPLVGTLDIWFSGDLAERPLVARCGESDWVPSRLFISAMRVGILSRRATELVSQRLADLARGRRIPSAATAIDSDPEYEDWIFHVSRARFHLLAKANQA